MHKTIWFKIHWFLGITAGIILLVVGITGAIMSFEKEILKAINSESYVVNVPQNQEKLNVKELLEKFQSQMPEAKINSISFSNNPEESTTLNIASKESRKGINYYVNPYTAEILPDIVGKDFFGFILRPANKAIKTYCCCESRREDAVSSSTSNLISTMIAKGIIPCKKEIIALIENSLPEPLEIIVRLLFTDRRFENNDLIFCSIFKSKS